jgi:hypothetical protein
MQAQITIGYLTIAKELGLPVAPVGVAWAEVRKQAPEIELWQTDGSHPNNNGTYLATCVLYAVIFRESPVGLAYTSQISGDTAKVLQTIASEVVVDNPAEWNLH